MNGSEENNHPPAQPVLPEAPAQPAPQQQYTAGFVPGMPSPAVQDPRTKSPLLACFLSAMPGLGQIYVGYYVRGFVHAITVAVLITLLASTRAGHLIPLMAIFLAFFWLYNIIDAGRRAAFYNQALAGGEAPDLPPEMKIPRMGGSIFAGVGLIILGAVLLSYTRFDMSLDWVEDWWPVAPIALGAYLVVLAIRDRTQNTEEADRT